MEGLLAKCDHLNMVKMQQMVRVTCLEVMGASPAQIDAFRSEVVELQSLVKGYLSEVAQLREQAAPAPTPQLSCKGSDWTPSSPSTASVASHSVPGPAPTLSLDSLILFDF